ncbi:MAG: hypothetical protein KAW41_03740 [Candidatus Diapherotrites archaeon]|nr:hypothetical protein [Candidatus Diapherotrites archaeon]
MAEKPKILQIVADMRAEGFSDDKIVDNLRQLGLTDDQVKRIMQVADKDVYSKFKREMNTFIAERIQKSQDIIDSMVAKALEKKMESVKKDMLAGSETRFGEFAKTVNEKSTDMTLAVKKMREENLRLAEAQKLNRLDIDSLLGGPSQWRLIASMFFLFFGIAVILYVLISIAPQVISLDFTDLNQGVILLLQSLGLITFAIISVAVGIYFTGRPGRQ